MHRRAVAPSVRRLVCCSIRLSSRARAHPQGVLPGLSRSNFSPDRPGWSAAGHSRASATADITKDTVCCGTLAIAATAGRHPWRVPVYASCTSSAIDSTRNATIIVHTVFSCVASRNTQRVSYWPSGRGAARHSKTGGFSAERVIKHPVDVPSGTGPGLPRQRFESRRQIVFRRQRRVQLVSDGYGW